MAGGQVAEPSPAVRGAGGSPPWAGFAALAAGVYFAAVANLAGPVAGWLAGAGPVRRVDTNPLGTALGLLTSGPAGAWRPAPSAGLTWTVVAVLWAPPAAVAGWYAARRVGRSGPAGLAGRRALASALGRRAALRRAGIVRPSLAGRRHVELADAAMFLGHTAGGGTALWASHEDSLLLIGPPRMGKTLYGCVGVVLDAPGPVVATSTKTDLLTLTATPRAARGRVWAFDPEAVLAGGGWPTPLRWSPVAGCQTPAVALRRAAALVAARPLHGATNAGFFEEGAGTVLRCLLHAAALAGASLADVLAWAGDFTDETPANILREHPAAVRGWAVDLDTYTRGAAVETVSATQMSVGLVLKSLADPAVLAAACPSSRDGFDVPAFLTGADTVYLLSEGAGNSSTAPLITALVDEIIAAAKRASQHAPAGRLDPPLRLVLDEAANICPLPDLPLLAADAGGRGITGCTITRSFAQARHRWGKDKADALWGAATIKLLLGGLAEADELDRLSRLCGQRDVPVRSCTTSPGGRAAPAATTSLRRQPVLDVAALRALPTGQALLLYRNLPPALIRLRFWRRRTDATQIEAGQRQAHARLHPPA